jgi:hypothetical protein
MIVGVLFVYSAAMANESTERPVHGTGSIGSSSSSGMPWAPRPRLRRSAWWITGVIVPVGASCSIGSTILLVTILVSSIPRIGKIAPWARGAGSRWAASNCSPPSSPSWPSSWPWLIFSAARRRSCAARRSFLRRLGPDAAPVRADQGLEPDLGSALVFLPVCSLPAPCGRGPGGATLRRLVGPGGAG